MKTPEPITIAQLPEGWIADRREIILRDGNAVRVSATRPAIEIKSLTTNEWLLLTLAGGAIEFTTYSDRDAVAKQLQEGTP